MHLDHALGQIDPDANGLAPNDTSCNLFHNVQEMLNMFGFGSRAKARREAQEEFDATCQKLRVAPELAQVALGHAINQAHSMFIGRFGSVGAFSKLPSEEQFAYMESLSTAALAFMREKKDAPSSMGFDLFKMWVGMVVARDTELIDKFARELAYFSKKCEGLGARVVPSAASQETPSK
jgi:hypothetical protein